MFVLLLFLGTLLVLTCHLAIQKLLHYLIYQLTVFNPLYSHYYRFILGLHPAFLQSPAFAQLRTALTALGGTQGAAGGGVVAPTPVVLASNLNDKVCNYHCATGNIGKLVICKETTIKASYLEKKEAMRKSSLLFYMLNDTLQNI